MIWSCWLTPGHIFSPEGAGPREPLSRAALVRVLDGCFLGTVSDQSRPVDILLGDTHLELTQFQILYQPCSTSFPAPCPRVPMALTPQPPR